MEQKKKKKYCIMQNIIEFMYVQVFYSFFLSNKTKKKKYIQIKNNDVMWV